MFSFKQYIVILMLAVSFTFYGCGRKNEAQQPLSRASQPIRLSNEMSDASEPAIAVSNDGTVYVAWVEHRNNEADVMVARLNHDSRLEGSPVRVNSQPGIATAWRGDPPTIARASDGTVFVGWTARAVAENHTTDLYLSTSHDQGRTFSSVK